MQPHEVGPDDQGRIWDSLTRTYRQETPEEKEMREAAQKGFGSGHSAPPSNKGKDRGNDEGNNDANTNQS